MTPEQVPWNVTQGLTSAQQRELRSIALVPVANNTRLLPPERLFLRLRDDLAPFAYELQAPFTAHTAVLQELGMRQHPTAADLVKLVVVCVSCSSLVASYKLNSMAETCTAAFQSIEIFLELEI
jgi:hypothetical protein